MMSTPDSRGWVRATAQGNQHLGDSRNTRLADVGRVKGLPKMLQVLG